MPQAGRDITGRIFNHSTLDYVWKFIHLSTLIIASIPACSRQINMMECTPAQCFLGFVGGVKHIWSRGQHCYTVMLMVGQWTVAASILTLILPWDDTVFREGSFSLFIIENLIQHFCTSRHQMHLIFAKQVHSMIMLGCLSVNLH